MIQMKLFGECNLKGYTLIEGFPGIGLVGPMASSYMIEKEGMEYIGYIDSDMFPPLAVIHDKKPMYPARIYKDDKYKLVILISEFTIPSVLIHQLGTEITEFIRKSGITQIVSIGGMPSQKPSDIAYVTSPDRDQLKKATGQGLKAIDEGVVAGVSAVLLTNASQFKIPMLNLLVEVNPEMPDPKYAEVAISALNKALGIKIDLDELEKEAKDVEERLREMVKKVKDSHEHYSKAADTTPSTGPSMYA